MRIAVTLVAAMAQDIDLRGNKLTEKTSVDRANFTTTIVFEKNGTCSAKNNNGLKSTYSKVVPGRQIRVNCE